MSSVKLRAGVELHNMSPDEFRGIVREESALQRAGARALKWMRLPEVLQGKASAGVLSLGIAVAKVGPDQGYGWRITRLVVDGLTTGATPDVVNLYRNDNTNGAPLWQFNGNNFGYTFGKGQMTLSPGDTLMLASVGTFAATGTIRLSGEIVEAPAEQLIRIVD
jgi:hypothetical protein